MLSFMQSVKWKESLYGIVVQYETNSQQSLGYGCGEEKGKEGEGENFSSFIHNFFKVKGDNLRVFEGS